MKTEDKFRKAMSKARNDKNMSKTKLAEHIGKSTSMICDIEAGRKNPSVSTMIDIAKVLEISLDSIFLTEITLMSKNFIAEER